MRTRPWLLLPLFCPAVLPPAAPGQSAELRHVREIGDASFKHAHSLTHIQEFSGNRLLASAEDGAARLWDLETGGELLRFDHGQEDVWNAIPLQGDKHVATAGEHVRIWDLSNGKMLRQLDHAEGAFRLAAIPGTTLLASGHDAGVILIRNWETGETVRELKYEEDEVFSLVAPAQNRLIVGGDDGTLQLFDLDSGDELEKVTQDESTRITTVSLSADGSRIVVNRGKNFTCYQAADLSEIWSKKLDDSATIAAWAPDGASVATCSDDTLFLLDAGTGDIRWRKELPFGDHRAVAFAADGKSIYSGGDRMIYRFSAATGKQVYPDPAGHHLRGKVAVGGFSADGGTLFAGGADHRLHRFEVDTGKALEAWKLTHRVDDLGMVPGEDRILAADKSGNVTEYTTAGVSKGGFNLDSYYDFGVACDGVIITEHSEGIRRWSRGGMLGMLGPKDSGYECVGVAPGGKLVATATEDPDAVRIWDAATGEMKRAITSEIVSPRDVFLFPDASIAVLSDGSQLYAWFEPAADELEGHDERIAALITGLTRDAFADRERAKRGLIALGTGVVPHLERIESDDPELRLQIAQVMRLLRERLSGAMQQVLGAGGSIMDFAAHPDGVHWAAVVGSGHTSQVVLGSVDRETGEFASLQSISDANGPTELRFSPGGDLLVTGNGNGTLSLYRFEPAPAE